MIEINVGVRNGKFPSEGFERSGDFTVFRHGEIKLTDAPLTGKFRDFNTPLTNKKNRAIVRF